MGKLILAALALAGVGATAAKLAPEVQRFIKIRSM